MECWGKDNEINVTHLVRLDVQVSPETQLFQLSQVAQDPLCHLLDQEDLDADSSQEVPSARGCIIGDTPSSSKCRNE